MGNKGLFIKIILAGITSFVTILSVVYYGKCYIINHSLMFTKSDKFILLFIAVCVLIVIIVLIALIFNTFKMRKCMFAILEDLNVIKEEIYDIEDNSIELQRVTQKMIMDLSKELGVTQK